MSNTIPRVPDGGKVHSDAWSTEQEAALLQTGERKAETYAHILNLLAVYGYNAGFRGLTDDELRERLRRRTGHPQSKSGPATRRGELVELGLVRPRRGADGALVKRPSDAGGPMIVWEIVPGDEYVKTEPVPKAKRGRYVLDLDALAVAEQVAEWEIGDPAWAEIIVRAYLDPKAAQAKLDEQRGAF